MRAAVMGRRCLAALSAGTMLMAVPAAGAPPFVPSPRQAFEGFVAINAPRPEVPVGALWIDGYGPTGEGASADNLETVRSLNAVTMDRALQLSLTAGLFSLLGIEPRLRDRHTARFTDLTIVRVRDVSRLTGPRGEPRIIEAIKAGSVTVSTDGEIGLNARILGWEPRDIEGSADNARTRNYAIEGRDLFVAIRVATPTLVSGKDRLLDVAGTGSGDAIAKMDRYLIAVRGSSCAPSANLHCSPASYGVIKLNSYPVAAPAEQIVASAEGESRLPLPIPVADENGGLFDAVTVRWIAPCAVRKVEHCRKKPRLLARFVGVRLQDLRSPEAKGW